jgi:hypothetical protein
MQLDESNEAKMQACPHCHAKLTLREAVTIIHGTGFRRMEPVKLPTGKVSLMEIGEIYPSFVDVLE